MKSLSTVSVAAILVAGAWTVCVRADDPPSIDGTWEVRRFDKATCHEFAGLELVLKSDGDTLRGTAVWPDGKETPIAAGSIAGGRVSFKVTPGSVIQDYGGEIDGDVIRGRWAAGIAAFDWEARRAATERRAAIVEPIGFTTERDVTFSQGRQEAFAGIDVEVDRRRGTPALRFEGLYAVRVEREEWSMTTAQEMWREYQEGQFAVCPTERGAWVSLEGKLPIVIYLGGVGFVEVREYSDGDPLTMSARYKLLQFPLGHLGYETSEAAAASSWSHGFPAELAGGADQEGEPFHDIEQEFTGVSDTRSLEAALSEALRRMDRAVADQAQSPCSRVTWRVVEISGTSGTPAGLNRIEVKIVASFEGALSSP